jgi:ribosomal protein S27E
MVHSMPVRCPACRREHGFSPPEYPCTCGAAVSVPLLPGGGAVLVRHRSWSEAWAEVTCAACGKAGQWPQPEFCCPCGAMVRLSQSSPDEDTPPDPDRPAFRPVTIRTAYDAVSCAAQFLRWLGFQEVRTAVPRPASGIDLRGPRVVGLVDPTTVPTAQRDIETLWLHGLTESVTAVAFSLAGYDREARGRADELRLPLFVLDLTGTPQPVNDPADALLHRGETDD